MPVLRKYFTCITLPSVQVDIWWWEVQFSKCAGVFSISRGLDTFDSGWILKEPHVGILAKYLKLCLEEGLSS
jgi:hypothetical protein